MHLRACIRARGIKAMQERKRLPVSKVSWKKSRCVSRCGFVLRRKGFCPTATEREACALMHVTRLAIAVMWHSSPSSSDDYCIFLTSASTAAENTAADFHAVYEASGLWSDDSEERENCDCAENTEKNPKAAFLQKPPNTKLCWNLNWSVDGKKSSPSLNATLRICNTACLPLSWWKPECV